MLVGEYRPSQAPGELVMWCLAGDSEAEPGITSPSYGCHPNQHGKGDPKGTVTSPGHIRHLRGEAYPGRVAH